MPDLTVAARTMLLDSGEVPDTELYQRLLTEAPVLKTAGCWMVSGHAEVSQLAADPRLTIDPRAGDPPLPLTQSERLDDLFGRMLNFRDGQAHARLRRLVAAAFSARRVTEVSATVEQVVADLIDDLFDRGSFDAVADLGVPLPVMSSCALLDLPRDSWSDVAAWAERMSGQLFRFGQTPAQLAEVEEELAALTRYIDELARERRGRAGDLIADLLESTEDPAGLTGQESTEGGAGRLTRDEFVAFVVLLFMNGLETVTAAVSSCVAALLWRPGVAEMMRDVPHRATEVFDELMRLDSPARMGARRATAPIELAGHVIGAGEVVFLLWAVANRDPRIFADPDEFQPGRAGRHVAFGKGPHHCLGSTLAAVQGTAVLRQLAQRAHLSSPVDQASAPRRRSVALAGFASLPITVGTSHQRTARSLLTARYGMSEGVVA